MKKFLFIFAFAFLFAVPAQTEDAFRIEVGKNYSSYSNEELRRRVWQLERAVSQLQDQVFQLALHNGSNNSGSGSISVSVPSNAAMWTCQIQSFGKTHISSGRTRSSALAQVLKKCSDATNAIHCSESEVKCSDE
jgi:hypothetical protein